MALASLGMISGNSELGVVSTIDSDLDSDFGYGVVDFELGSLNLDLGSLLSEDSILLSVLTLGLFGLKTDSEFDFWLTFDMLT